MKKDTHRRFQRSLHMQLASLACITLGLWTSGCGGDDSSPADPESPDAGASDTGAPDTGAPDVGDDAPPGADATTDAMTDAANDTTTDADQVDAAGDAIVPPPVVDVIGTPPRPPTGAGERPVVFWPKPTYAHPDVPVRFTMVAFDPEHEQLLYSLEGEPAGMTIDASGTIDWDPPPTGTFDFEVLIDDGRADPERVPVSLTVDATKFLFVSPTGSDGAGTIDEPLGDLDAAQRRLADMGAGVLYIRGGTYVAHWHWETAGVASPFKGVNGTADAPLVVRGYPGESVIVDCEEDGHGFWSFQTSFVLFADLEVRRPAAPERGGLLLGGHDVVAQNVTVRDANWPVSSNCTGFLLRGDNSVCHRCRGYDNYDRTSDHWNSSNFLTYPDSGQARIYILDSHSEGSSSGYKIKHAGAGQVLLHGNFERGSGHGFGGMDDDSVIRFNTFVDNDTGLSLAITDPSAFTAGNMEVHNNTVIGAHRAVWLGDSYANDGGLSLRNNVIVMNDTLGAGESDPLMAFAKPYTDAPDPGVLDFSENCYHAPNADAGFRFGSGAAGSFADWQGHGLDVTSVWGDPMFDTSSGEDYRVGIGSPCESLAGVGAW